jgi:hypothetical protein
MRFLYLIFVLSVAALIWVAIAVTRHIRRHVSQSKSEAEAAAILDEITNESLMVGGRKHP